MTEIDVPDWVVEVAMAAGEKFASENTVSMYATVRDLRREEMRTSITAALGAWVVLGPYRFLKNGDNPSDWLDRQINGEPPNPKHLREDFRIENAYTLRQEKPE